VLVLAAVAGALWLGALAVMGYLQLPEPSTPSYLGVPVPTLMLLGGVTTGLLLALACRLLVRWSARSKARSADRRLRGAITDVAERMVLEPIETELAAYRTTRDGLAVAAKAG